MSKRRRAVSLDAAVQNILQFVEDEGEEVLEDSAGEIDSDSDSDVENSEREEEVGKYTFLFCF